MPVRLLSRSFIKPSVVRYSEVKTGTATATEAETKTAVPAETQDTSVVAPNNNGNTLTNINDDPASAIAFLKKINDDSLQLMQEISDLSEQRAAELVQSIQEQQKPSSEKLQKLDRELQQFLTDFVGDKEKFGSNNNQQQPQIPGNQQQDQINSSYNKYPFLKKSSRKEPYTAQELHLRQVHHANAIANLGSTLSDDVYFPFKDLSSPPSHKDITIDKLLAAGAHLGQSTSLWRPSTQQYIYGEYKGIHIIDLEQTVSHLKRAAKVVEGVAEKGGLIVFLGTREGQQRAVENAAKRSQGYYVSERWIPGTITNCTEISKRWERHEVDLKDEPTGRQLTELENSTLVKPDLIVVLNPVENRNALKEAAQARIPTVGIIDTDSEPSLVTYPIPANDDSIRATNLICGVLGRAGQTGRERRLSRVLEYQGDQQVGLRR